MIGVRIFALPTQLRRRSYSAVWGGPRWRVEIMARYRRWHSQLIGSGVRCGHLFTAGTRVLSPPGPGCPWRCLMATATASTSLFPVMPVFSDAERLALAGYLAGEEAASHATRADGGQGRGAAGPDPPWR